MCKDTSEPELSQQIRHKYNTFLKLKRNTIKLMHVTVPPGLVLHPAYLEREAHRTGRYWLNELLRGCLYSPPDVALGYREIIEEHYADIYPKPTYKQLMAMYYGVLWNGYAYELLCSSGVSVPASPYWRDYRRTSLKWDGVDICEYDYITPSDYILEPWSTVITTKRLLMFPVKPFTPLEQHMIQRVILNHVFYQVVSLDVEFLTKGVITVLSHINLNRLPACWRKSRLHKQLLQQALALQGDDTDPQYIPLDDTEGATRLL